MIVPVFSSSLLGRSERDALLISIGADRLTWAPRLDSDGHCRLHPAGTEDLPYLMQPTSLPVKKLFLPHREAVWSFRPGQFSAVEFQQPFAVIGLPLCDLQAIWYLDRVFEADSQYRARRSQALLVGMTCEPGPECRCEEQLMPLAGDLFIAAERVWALSPQGEALLRQSGCNAENQMPLPWPKVSQEERPSISIEGFFAAAKADIWAAEAQRCLSCGACSAVCPTCYCFDMLDDASLDGSVTRRRSWDNCFFSEHGKVAGGYDFRPGRTERLRFRMEHKYYGFGDLRGQNSCVGCGRCRKACPVDIDLDRIAERLGREGV